ncbi:hypothetical protein K7640_27275 [Micromonospora sp. PLK6-60]|uniref:hypothetical protein n=1 Tax=Micromonospora sp. PLK6-60 TaxID=2873383 RepID=UPI001CA70988|nr:hypothetical protein [Micromonospora sp. PLK6-60]MBY8875539.1 hypothetical protein [Micromonospora sp. PLK6-60]
MAMAHLPAARRHHRSRIAYAFGLLALVGAVAILVVAVRYPAESATRLSAPVPAPEITVPGEEGSPGTDPGWVGGPWEAQAAGADATRPPDVPAAGPTDGTLTEARGRPSGPADYPDAARRSLFWSGVLGLAISLAGLGLVGTRRRGW